MLKLSIPRSDRGAKAWAERSFFLDICEDGKSAEEDMRQAVIQDQICVHLNARVHESKVVGAESAFRVDHRTVDGVGHIFWPYTSSDFWHVDPRAHRHFQYQNAPRRAFE